jgi:hypothetical protein
MPRAGRPDKLTDEEKAEVAAEIAAGVPKTVALGARGLERHAFDEWLKKPKFSTVYGQKRREVIERWLKRLEAAPWQATAWLLERIYKEDFAQASGPSVQVNTQVLQSTRLDEAEMERTRMINANECEDFVRHGFYDCRVLSVRRAH